jgi:hypothetical protein
MSSFGPFQPGAEPLGPNRSEGQGLEDDVSALEASLQRLQRALDSAGQGAERFGRAAAGGAAGAVGGAAAAAAAIGASAQDAVLGFAGNYAFREGRTFARGTALGVAAGAATDTLPVSEQGLGLAALQNLPLGAGSQVTDPLNATAGRVAGITSAIARAGGQVSEEQRQQLFDFFGGQERRADAERRAVSRSAAGNVGAFIEGTNVGAALDLASGVGASVSRVLNSLGLGGR